MGDRRDGEKVTGTGIWSASESRVRPTAASRIGTRDELLPLSMPGDVMTLSSFRGLIRRTTAGELARDQKQRRVIEERKREPESITNVGAKGGVRPDSSAAPQSSVRPSTASSSASASATCGQFPNHFFPRLGFIDPLVCTRIRGWSDRKSRDQLYIECEIRAATVHQKGAESGSSVICR